jgi:hypothetical protein
MYEDWAHIVPYTYLAESSGAAYDVFKRVRLRCVAPTHDDPAGNSTVARDQPSLFLSPVGCCHVLKTSSSRVHDTSCAMQGCSLKGMHTGLLGQVKSTDGVREI